MPYFFPSFWEAFYSCSEMLGEFMFKIIKSCHSTAQYLCKPSGGGSGIYTRLSTGAGNTTRHELNPLEQQTGLHQWRKTTELMLSRTALLVLTLTYLSPSFSPSRSNRKKSGANNQYFRDKYCCWTIIFTPWKKKKKWESLAFREEFGSKLELLHGFARRQDVLLLSQRICLALSLRSC